MAKTMNEIKQEIVTVLKQMTTAIAKNDHNGVAEGEAKVKSLEKTYAGLALNAEYEKLNNQEQPFMSAIIQRTYTTLRHSAITDEEGKTVGYELTDKVRQFDMLEVCRKLGLDTEWQYLMECINMQFTMRVAKEVGLTKQELNEIPLSYAMQKRAREIVAKGGVVTSNAKCKEALQELLDAMPTPSDDNGNPILKCNSYDVAYIVNCYCKKGKNALGLATAKKGFFCGLVSDVIYRIATNGKYSVEYKQKKQ